MTFQKQKIKIILTAQVMANPEKAFMPRSSRGGRPEEGSPLPPQELQNRIQVLDKELQEHEGELVLMIVRHWEPYGFDMPEERTPYGLDEEYYLGIIAPPYIQVKNYQIKIETKKNVNFDPRRPHLGIKGKEGPINDWHAGEMNLGRSSRLEPDRQKRNKELLEIIVGNQNVAAWIEKEVIEGNTPSWRLDLKRRRPELFDEEEKVNVELLRVFQRMHLALGEELFLSEEVTQRANEALHKAKTKILTSINKLLQREDQLTGRIRSIFDFVEQGGGILQVGGGIILVESEEDARVETMGSREGLREIRLKIGSELKRAFEFGMHETEMTIETEIRPGYKEVLDVEMFIRGLCQYYEIPIPSSSS